MTYASFWKRLVALIIDTVLIDVVSYILGFIVGLIIGFAGTAAGFAQDALVSMAGIIGLIAGLCVFLLYYALFESSVKQATLGKMAMGIKVIDVYGNKLTFGKALLRAAGKFISLILIGLGCLVAAFTEKKQAMHDFIAKTLVVNS